MSITEKRRPVRVARRSPSAPSRSPLDRLPPLLVALRPKQWLKNGLVFLPLFFSVNEQWQPLEPSTWLGLLAKACLAFVAFCAVASAEYLINDLRDIERDRLHPKKRRRPLAAGTLSPQTAMLTAALLGLLGALIAAVLGWRFALALGAYAIESLLYTYWLKHQVLLDVLTPAVGFVLRTVGGAYAIHVPVSPWLYILMLLGSLFVFIYKRRNELLVMDASASAHRPILAEYTTELLDQLAAVVTASTIGAYSLYTFTAPNLPANHAMMATVPFVLYGIFRYMYIVYRHESGGSPEDIIVGDKPLLACVVLWLVTAAGILILFR